MSESVSLEAMEELLAPFQGKPGTLLAIFHTIQHEFGYVPPEGVFAAAKTLGLSTASVYGTLTFYSDFRTEPPPHNTVELCHGPACHLKGALKLKAIAEDALGIQAGQLNPGGHTEIHLTQCPGLCDHAPTVVVNDQFFSRVQPDQMPEVLKPLSSGSAHP